MADTSQTSPAAFNLEGGLVLNRSTFLMQPGEALQLENFEPDIQGGYRRITGHTKFINHIIPQTSASSEKVLMVSTFANKVLAARGEKIFSSASTELASAISSSTGMTGSGTITVDSTTGFSSSGTLQIESEIFTYTGVTSTTFTGVTRATASTTAANHVVDIVVSESWTEIDTGRSNAGKYSFERYNFDGNDKIIFVDGDNAPVIFNTSLSATDVSASSVAGSKFVAVYKNHMFYAGKSTTPQELVFSVPFDEDDFTSGSGAGSIKVDDTIVGLKVFRDNLFIFCENRIFNLTGSSLSDFAIKPVTRNIGCINGDTIQEFAGDLIFLGPDGLRTVAATARIGDVELGTITRNVQSLFDENIRDAAIFDSVVIPDKTQYRIFFTKDGQVDSLTRGVVCVMKGQNFEFSEIRGVKPSCTDTFIEAGNVLVLHGDFNGFVHRQEKGNTFDGTTIFAKYRSPDLGFGDTGIRKHMRRVIINYKPESAIDADLIVRYDNESATSARPAVYPLDSTAVAAQYGTATYSTTSETAQFVYGGPSQPLVRQSVEGSGFTVALRVNDGGVTAPYSLKGFQLEYQVGARR
jgi:hypothetical protein|tara:strand:- start:160 stop:1899 length:1740 start_codon:yes stop_codon:yes gene_type:complete